MYSIGFCGVSYMPFFIHGLKTMFAQLLFTAPGSVVRRALFYHPAELADEPNLPLRPFSSHLENSVQRPMRSTRSLFLKILLLDSYLTIGFCR